MPGSGDSAARGRDDMGRAFRRAAQRTWLARGLMVLAVVIVLQHLLAHAGWRPVPMSMGNQDLLIGYPAGAVVGIVGLVVWGNTPHRG